MVVLYLILNAFKYINPMECVSFVSGSEFSSLSSIRVRWFWLNAFSYIIDCTWIQSVMGLFLVLNVFKYVLRLECGGNVSGYECIKLHP